MFPLLFERITNHPDNRTNERGGAGISTVFICMSRLGQVADETGHMIGELDAHTCRKTKEQKNPKHLTLGLGRLMLIGCKVEHEARHVCARMA